MIFSDQDIFKRRAFLLTPPVGGYSLTEITVFVLQITASNVGFMSLFIISPLFTATYSGVPHIRNMNLRNTRP